LVLLSSTKSSHHSSELEFSTALQASALFAASEIDHHPDSMATPVTTDKWAGNLECTGPCRRKRLTADEFSKTALEKHRRAGGGGPIKCKQCVAAAERQEREAAAAKRQQQATATSSTATTKNNDNGDTSGPEETRVCAGACRTEQSRTAYNNNQWNKGPGASRCRACVEQALVDERATQETAKSAKLQAAQQEVERAQKSGNAAAILKAESVLSALQAETVTGLKPVRMNRGRGRGGGRGRGRGGRGRR